MRYFDYDTLAVREDFITFAECDATTGESLSDAFLKNLRLAGVDVDKMRGQGYDGASNMSGKFRGVQARIRQSLPKAVYTHCKAHCLNLAIVHASEEPLARNMMNTVQEIAFSFNYSAKRLLRYKETLANDAGSKIAMEHRTKLQSLCETRWAARADALNTFQSSYITVVEALADLCLHYGDSKAGAYRIAIMQFGFIVCLVAIEHVLSGLMPLSKMLQNKSCDLIEAVKEANVITRQVTDERNDPAVWDVLYAKAVEMAEAVDVQPSRPRAPNNRRQQHRQNAPADTVSDYWKRNMYLPFVDHLVTELSDRLIEDGDRFNAQFLIPGDIGNLTEDIIASIYKTFEEDLPAVDFEDFKREVSRWKVRCAGDTEVHATVGDTLAHTPRELYPNVSTCLHILLAMPVSTATAERSFSSMRRLKTYLRSTMTTGRLSCLGLMNIHRDKEINTDMVIDVFARRKERRLAFVFRV